MGELGLANLSLGDLAELIRYYEREIEQAEKSANPFPTFDPSSAGQERRKYWEAYKAEAEKKKNFVYELYLQEVANLDKAISSSLESSAQQIRGGV